MLSVFFGSLKRLGALLFGKRRKPAASTPAASPVAPVISIDAGGAAVAGYVVRMPRRVDFHLPARIASVAHLNTPQGRKPAAKAATGANEVRRPVYAPQQKRSAPAKPLQAPTAGRAAARPSAVIIPMPARASGRGHCRRNAA